MQRKIRYHRIQLLAYDLFDAPRWSLPPASPGPTPLALKVIPRSRTYMPKKIHLVPVKHEIVIRKFESKHETEGVSISYDENAPIDLA
ncbi:MAG: hypothetical protein ACRDIV_16850 [Ktedonobacteraceae bacterium]